MVPTANQTQDRRQARRQTLRDPLGVKNDRASYSEGLEISGHELSALLAPITPEVFMTEYWGRKPLLIKGEPEKLRRLIPGGFTAEDFHRIVHEKAAKNISTPVMTESSDPLEAIFVRGRNLALEAIRDPQLATLAVALKTQLNHLGEAHFAASLSQQDNGWPLHVDKASILSFQCEGRKRFVISARPAVEWPRGSIIFRNDGAVASYLYNPEPWEEIERVDLSDLIEVTLEPGDILYWPAGTLHATQSLSPTTLNLNLGFHHANFLELVTKAIEGILTSNPSWRHLPPVNAQSAPGRLPVEAVEFIAARLAELRDTLDTLSPEAMELNCQWHKLIADPGEETLPCLPLNPVEQGGRPVLRKETLRRSKKAAMTYATGTDQDGDPVFFLYFANREVCVGGEWAPFLQTLVEQDEFIAESATKWAGAGRRYPWETVREYLMTLLAQGFIERVTA
jgi:ribosomal protein L16 Arg81 hydroxylase